MNAVSHVYSPLNLKHFSAILSSVGRFKTTVSSNESAINSYWGSSSSLINPVLYQKHLMKHFENKKKMSTSVLVCSALVINPSLILPWLCRCQLLNFPLSSCQLHLSREGDLRCIGQLFESKILLASASVSAKLAWIFFFHFGYIHISKL